MLQHGEQRGAEAAEFIGRKLAEALDDSEARRGQPLRVAETFVQMDSSSGKTVSKLVRPTVDDDTKVERTPVRGLVKVQRPVEGRQVKLLCAQAKGEASWAYQAYIGEFDEAVVPLQGLAATRGWQDGTLAVMTSHGEPSIQEVGKGAFHPNFRFILDHPHAMTHLGDVPLHAAELLQKRACATHHDAFKQRNWPIASGNVEGGLIHPVTKRGAGWLVENLNGVVALACVRRNEWWDEFWAFVRSRRQQRRETAEAAKKAA